MGDRFYCQRDNLTLSLQPDRRSKPLGIPTYYRNKQPTMYPIPGKVYSFSGIEKIYDEKTGWQLVTTPEPTFPENPKLGQVVTCNGISFVFIPKQGWVNTLSLVF